MTHEEDTPEAIVFIDFQTTFPHKAWISTWSKDGSYPKGFRYKMFTVRLADEDMVRIVLILEEPGGYKTEMERLKVPPSAVDRTCAIFVDGLAEEHSLDFEEQDLSDVTSAEEYEKRVTSFGWYEWRP